MATRPRDPAHNHNGHRQSRSTRNKENIPHAPSPSPSPSSAPAPAPAPARGPGLRPSLVKARDKQAEFWTDSFLDNNSNASQTSLIPSPLPSSNAPLSKPRRTVRPQQPFQGLQHPPHHRQTRSELPATRPEDLRRSHQKPLARGTSPIRSTGLSTPPRSREGSFAGSPNQILSSPPQALTDTYSRIDQEEDLAATEGELSDPESEIATKEDAPTTHAHLGTNRPSSDSPQPMSRSRAATPTDQTPLHAARPSSDENFTSASVFSDPTGLSFVDQLSDPALRSTLTPHMLQSAADRDALYRTWKSKKPIAFGKAGSVLLDPDDVADSTSSSPRLQPERVIAFSKAGKIKLASDHLPRPPHQRTFSDVTEQIDRATHQQSRPVHSDNWHGDDFRKDAMPHNPRLHRDPYFPRNHGFPERNPAFDRDRLAPDSFNQSFRKARSESPFTSTSRTAPGAARPRRGSSDQDHLSARSKSLTQAQDVYSEADSASDIWAHAAADSPLKSIESDTTQPGSQRRQSDIQDLQMSSEKSRKFDMDFTGQSFQVSESPPVRGRNVTQDYLRDREIRGLAQQAVTTNRLSQLRAKESQEKLRQQSRSPVSESGDHHVLEKKVLDAREPDTSTIYRTSSNGSGPKCSTATVAGPTPDRPQSHDILQRLARGSSSTPRSATPSDNTINGVVTNGGNESDTRVRHAQEIASNGPLRRDASGMRRPVSGGVQVTPKVVGAWTDTILPDTIKTTRRNTQNSRYGQTPHVSAGGWIDTPAAHGHSGKLEPVQEATHEIPEELMNGIGKDGASDRTLLADDQPRNSTPASPTQAGESLARKILSEAEEQSDSQDTTRQRTDDSLVLGQATILSLKNVLDLDDTTILSQLGADDLSRQSDTEVLDRLGTKLDRLRTHIHDARKGITKLEHQISQPSQPEIVVITPNAAQQPLTTGLSSFPLGILTLSIPVPILYRARNNGQCLPRPTPLGWAVLMFWFWYLLECILAGLYSHPIYAQRYTWPTQREPEFPYVLPTMLWRWSHLQFLHPSVVQPLQKVLVAIFRMVGMWFGMTDGFTDRPAEALVGPQNQFHDQEQNLGFDMMNDEYL